MERDFSEASKQRLLGLVDEVENSKWNNFTDWNGDRWYDFTSWIGQLNIQKYINNVNEYHKKIIDKNNTSKQEIENIFAEVNSVSDRYKVRFASILSQVKTYRSMISLLSATVNPAHGVFKSTYIGNLLVDSLNKLLQSNEVLEKISGNGINNDDFSNLSDDIKAYVLSKYVSSIVDALPNFKLGTKNIELPIGPDITLYYSVEGKYDNDSDININMQLDEHKIKIKNFSMSSGDLFGIGAQANSDGKVNVTGSNDSGSVSFDNLSGISNGTPVKIGDTTYTINLDIDPNGDINFSETVRSDFESGYISSTIGIKKHNNQDSYVPTPVPAGETVQSLSLSTPEGKWQAFKIFVDTVLPDTGMSGLSMSDLRALSESWKNGSIYAGGAFAGTGIMSQMLPYLVLCPI